MPFCILINERYVEDLNFYNHFISMYSRNLIKGRNISRQETTEHKTLNFKNLQLVLKLTGRSFLLLAVFLHDQYPNQTRYELFYGCKKESISARLSSVWLNACASNFLSLRKIPIY